MQAIEKISVVQQAVDHIKNYILSDNVKIGDKLPTEQELCSTLKVGRGTVREAIRVLQTKGYVELSPGRGSFIASKEEFDKNDLANWFRENEIKILDCIEVRAVIEPLAVKLAIQKCTDRDVQKLRSIQNRSISAVKKFDVATLAQCDEQFHTHIVECSQNMFLIDINKKINYSLTSFRSKTFNIIENANNLIPKHEAIILAFEKRDIELGQKSMSDHLSYVAEDLETSKLIV